MYDVESSPVGDTLRLRIFGLRRTLAIFLVTLSLTLLGSTGADPARAHADLLRSDPPADGVLSVPPRQIDLWFSERIDPGGALSVRLLDLGGQEYPVSAVQVDQDDPKHVTADASETPPGTLTVLWSVRSLDDGHTLSGTFAFRVGAGRAPGAATTGGERPAPWAVATRWLTFFGAALAAAGFAFGPLLRRDAASPAFDRLQRRAVAAGVVLALCATLAEPLLQTRWPPAGTVSPSTGEAIAGMPNGWWLRAGALCACGVIVAVAVMRPEGSEWRRVLCWAGFACAFACLFGLSLTSHASARENWRLTAIAVNVAHQWSVALWVGGLTHLMLWWRPVQGRFS